MKAWEATEAFLREIGEPSVMYGDEWIAHQIARQLGWEREGPRTTRRLLAALARTPGTLHKSLVSMPSDCCARGQAVLCFSLEASD